MTQHIDSTTIRDGIGRGPRWLGLACATALTTVVVVGLGGWRLREQGSVRPMEPAVAAAVSTSTVGRPLVRGASAVRYLYLVSSEEEAGWLSWAITEANAHRYQLGEQPLTIPVLVTKGLDDDVLGVLTRLQPDQIVVDLRGP